MVQTEDGKNYTAHLSIDNTGNNGKKCHHIHFSTKGEGWSTDGYWTADTKPTDFIIYCIRFRERLEHGNRVIVNDERTMYYYTYEDMEKDYRAFFRTYVKLTEANRVTNRKEHFEEGELPFTNGTREIAYTSACKDIEERRTITVRAYTDEY